MLSRMLPLLLATLLLAGCLDAGAPDAPGPPDGADDAGADAPDAAGDEPAPPPGDAGDRDAGDGDAPADGGASDPGDANATAPPSVTPTGPWWSFADTEGATHSRDTAAGRPAVLFFMASWCGTCRGTAPVLARVHADRGGDAGFYSLTFDASDDRESLERWKAEHAQPWPHGVDDGFRAQRAFGVTAQSSVVVLDAEGEVVEKWGYARVTETALRAALDAALARGP